MITLERVQAEIKELMEQGCMSSQCLKDLSMLYWLEGKMQMQQWGSSLVVVPPMSREAAEKWTAKMENADGSRGEHWNYDQAEQVMRRQGIRCDPAEFYATINMLWSDYGAVARKYGVDNPEFWADLSRAFLDDEDAVPDKVEMYHRYIVKK